MEPWESKQFEATEKAFLKYISTVNGAVINAINIARRCVNDRENEAKKRMACK